MSTIFNFGTVSNGSCCPAQSSVYGDYPILTAAATLFAADMAMTHVVPRVKRGFQSVVSKASDWFGGNRTWQSQSQNQNQDQSRDAFPGYGCGYSYGYMPPQATTGGTATSLEETMRNTRPGYDRNTRPEYDFQPPPVYADPSSHLSNTWIPNGIGSVWIPSAWAVPSYSGTSFVPPRQSFPVGRSSCLSYIIHPWRTGRDRGSCREDTDPQPGTCHDSNACTNAVGASDDPPVYVPRTCTVESSTPVRNQSTSVIDGRTTGHCTNAVSTSDKRPAHDPPTCTDMPSTPNGNQSMSVNDAMGTTPGAFPNEDQYISHANLTATSPNFTQAEESHNQCTALAQVLTAARNTRVPGAWVSDDTPSDAHPTLQDRTDAPSHISVGDTLSLPQSDRLSVSSRQDVSPRLTDATSSPLSSAPRSLPPSDLYPQSYIDSGRDLGSLVPSDNSDQAINSAAWDPGYLNSVALDGAFTVDLPSFGSDSASGKNNQPGR